MNPENPDAKTLDEMLRKVWLFGYKPSYSEMDFIQTLLLELKQYRDGGVTEEILRRNDGFIKVGRGCVIALDTPRAHRIEVSPPPVSVESRTIKNK